MNANQMDTAVARWWESLDDLARTAHLNQVVEYEGAADYYARRDPVIRRPCKYLDGETRRRAGVAYLAHLETNGEDPETPD